MNVLYPSIDGMSPKGSFPETGCCPPDLCSISQCAMSCSFIQLLPSGPLWDRAKAEGILRKGWCDDDHCSPTCLTLVNHAIYSSKRLYSYIFDILWPSIREANPYTAYDTMDDWLDKMGWLDCYNSFCRSKALGEQTPYEIFTECGPTFCPPIIPEELQRIYKRGVIMALTRLRRGIAMNIASINFVLEGLYSELVLDPEYNPDNPNTEPCLVLRPTADFGNRIIPEPCPLTEKDIRLQQQLIQLYLTPGHGVCVGSPPKVYPMLLAAHCIVRSLLPACDNICVKRIP